LILTSDGSSEVLNVNVTTSESHDTLPELVAAIDAIGGGWDATIHASIGTKEIRSDSMKSYAKTVIASLAIANTVELDYDDTNSRYYTNEITRAITEIKANVGDSAYLANAFAFPGGYRDATLIKWLQNNEADDIKMSFGTDSSSATIDPRESVNIYSIFRNQHSEVKGADSDITKAQSRTIAATLAVSGGIAGIYAHTEAEFSIADWSSLITALKEYNINIASPETVYDYITNESIFTGTDTDTEGSSVKEEWYFTALPSTLENLKLRRSSSAIDAGSPPDETYYQSGTWSDYSGNTKIYGNGLDMGAYEYKEKKSMIIPNIIFKKSVLCGQSDENCYDQIAADGLLWSTGGDTILWSTGGDTIIWQ